MENDPNFRCFADLLLAILKYAGIAAAFAAAAILGTIIGMLVTHTPVK